MSKAVSNVVSKAMSNDVSKSMSKGVSKAMSERVSNNVPNLSQGSRLGGLFHLETA